MGDVQLPGKRAILIAGPTASGKSALALTLAERYGGVVINADSMQVYADLHIVTARPSLADLTRVPHRLFGHVDAAQAYSVGHWLGEVKREIEAARLADRVPVLVGGTGLYIKALTQGLSHIPSVPDEIRTRLRAEAAVCTPSDLHARLAALDPGMAARLRPTDPQRILRALEIFETTGESLLSFQAVRESPVLPMSDVAGVFLAPPRPELNGRIDRRFDIMIEMGAEQEIAALAARKLDPTLPALRSLGVPPLMSALAGDLSLAEAINQAKLASRRYAKRQLTFARHQIEGLTWIDPSDAEAHLTRQWAS
ncbi:tRNA (adenosine(37)-N6)-dimethylallyltransferase MiaA [Lichenifustis flavocetrariae]|uniref:tRNA dimethylallyltransferase n=1 Tax=Lichenifustis flavocetrariae TaxID=2949735 RepID=A0AA41YXU9_9HYPH|nr:tRNA (adenosine(37)-N6)-dimethylallyltransferase MiaA [Lichenifustis flavocetrariae]MCW6510559.1 tRNA (adenosine(37)-N6)-dimethylallyltransferase MiaA [Lichenifustis flavocetrariae]